MSIKRSLTKDKIVDLAPLIHHAALGPFIDEEIINQACDASKYFGFSAICTNLSQVPIARERLGTKSTTKLISVIGFPFGCIPKELKKKEGEWAADEGAQELDIVPNFFAIKEKKYEDYAEEIAELCSIGLPVRAILDCKYFSNEELSIAIEGAIDAGVIGIQNSNGFGPQVNNSDIDKLSKLCRGKCEIKAVGGIKTLEQCLSMFESGASLIGTSLGPDLIKAFRKKSQ